VISPDLALTSRHHARRQCRVVVVLFDAASAPALAPLAAGGGGAAAEVPGAEAEAEAAWPLRFVCLDPDATPPFASALALPAPGAPVDAAARAGCRSSDTALHIFTSGTTGLPKAARLNHIRFFSAIVIPHLFGLTAEDRLYCCLPMCHTAAVGAISICWWLGIPLLLAPKFSASSFWRDCAAQRATVVQYVGELCRFLLATPPGEADTAHQVRLAFGNGLRPEVWARFQRRFGLKQIGELYASTEGNANLANTDGTEGAVGFISPLLARMYPVRLVRLAESDDSAEAGGEIARGADGLAVLCRPGEPGELLGLVNQRDAARNFAGYTDAAATRRKLVRGLLHPSATLTTRVI
jgi:acyl-CoA synthetase (AMP-forming)/AMP-acid ligase II